MGTSIFPSNVTGVTVETATAGALSGDGSSGNQLAVGVDGTTIHVNGSNQLAVVAGSELPAGWTWDASALTKTFSAIVPANVTATPGTSGSLSAGDYLVLVTAVNAAGYETRASAQVTATIGTGDDGSGSIAVSATAVAGATGYKVFVWATNIGTDTETIVSRYFETASLPLTITDYDGEDGSAPARIATLDDDLNGLTPTFADVWATGDFYLTINHHLWSYARLTQAGPDPVKRVNVAYIGAEGYLELGDPLLQETDLIGKNLSIGGSSGSTDINITSSTPTQDGSVFILPTASSGASGGFIASSSAGYVAGSYAALLTTDAAAAQNVIALSSVAAGNFFGPVANMTYAAPSLGTSTNPWASGFVAGAVTSGSVVASATAYASLPTPGAGTYPIAVVNNSIVTSGAVSAGGGAHVNVIVWDGTNWQVLKNLT